MTDVLQAYCVKCKEKRDIVNPTAVYTKTGSPATRGECAVCGTKLFRMGETPAHANVPKPEKIDKPKRKTSKKSKKSKSKSTRVMKNVGKLVIVESPAKARSVGGFLGKGYTVMASKGHIRDLPSYSLAVDVKNDFNPTYRVPKDKQPTVKELKAAVKGADEIYLATDPDREGEAIAWHLIAAANIDEDEVKRVVFHEITDSAVEHAFENPRHIDMDLVNSQQARRILDRLVGYNVSQLLWRKVRNNLSAGRVQSIALRLVVERDKEIDAFVADEYWTIDANLKKQESNGKDTPIFTAKLAKIDGKDPELKSESEVKPHVAILEKSQYVVDTVKRGTQQRKPSAPFITSTLQQEASRRFRFSAKRTMALAQQLYEGINVNNGNSIGLITYMRTDSFNVSPQAQQEARKYVTENFGDSYVPAKPRFYKTKSKSAQEAHEAIRPTNTYRTPASVKKSLTNDQWRLYKLIWERFVASQMSNAVYNTLRIDIKAGLTSDDMPYNFRATGRTIKFPGFLKLYEDTQDDDSNADDDLGRVFPELKDNDPLNLLKLLPEQHFTQPPPRYTEATLVRALEEHGIGRPSTYAPIVAVIQDRNYVEKEERKLVANDIGKTVNDLLVEYFPEEMDFQYTARLEEQLDEVARGEMDWVPMLREFYDPFQQRLENAREHMPSKREVEYVGRKCPTCHEGDLVYRYSKRGKFIGCSRYPDCRHTEAIVEHTGVSCPKCGDTEGGELVVRRTRKGRVFYGCSRFPDCDHAQWKLDEPKKKEEAQAAESQEQEAV